MNHILADKLKLFEKMIWENPHGNIIGCQYSFGIFTESDLSWLVFKKKIKTLTYDSFLFNFCSDCVN